MLADGDKVLAAVSGGIDSLVMLVSLAQWRRKAPIDFAIEAVIVDHGYWRKAEGARDPHTSIGTIVEELGVSCSIEEAWEMPEEETSCFQCARNRRSQLFDLARSRGMNKLAFGHHKDDLIETLFINLLYGGNISTMVPRQELFDGNLHIIRPLAYLEKAEVRELGEQFGLKPVPNYRPMSGDTRREQVRAILEQIYQGEPEARRSLFSALKNVRQDYLL